jgi:hypothetical protein
LLTRIIISVMSVPRGNSSSISAEPVVAVAVIRVRFGRLRR